MYFVCILIGNLRHSQELHHDDGELPNSQIKLGIYNWQPKLETVLGLCSN